jgi:membrane protein implicated in regulation of membrane protease activity
VALLAAILVAVFVTDGALDYVVIAVGLTIELAESAFWFRWSQRRRAAVGVETLVGRTIEVDADGWARIDGERWAVRGARPGERAHVVAVEGLTLVVERL